MFASRRFGRLQDKFQDMLAEPGKQVVLYGDTGVGKTSLVRYVCETQGIPMVYVECGGRFEDMLKEALAKAGITQDRFEAIEKKSAYGGVRGSLALLYAGGRHDVSEKFVSQSYPVSLPTAIREALSVEGFKVLFLDNFENLDLKDYGREVAVDIVQLMKSCSDREQEGVKVVVAGIPRASETLVELDAATGRRTDQLPVARMPDEELDEILTKGEAKLGIEFDGLCRTNIIRFSDGFPYYTHLHALQATRTALRNGYTRVGITDFMTALDDIFENLDLTLRRQYEDAAETTGKIKVRKSLMEALANLEKQEATFRDIKAAYWKIHPQYERSKQLDAINPHLTALVDKYGVLQSRGLPRSADRTYRFANPLMRAYVRLKAEQQKFSTPSFDLFDDHLLPSGGRDTGVEGDSA